VHRDCQLASIRANSAPAQALRDPPVQKAVVPIGDRNGFPAVGARFDVAQPSLESPQWAGNSPGARCRGGTMLE